MMRIQAAINSSVEMSATTGSRISFTVHRFSKLRLSGLARFSGGVSHRGGGLQSALVGTRKRPGLLHEEEMTLPPASSLGQMTECASGCMVENLIIDWEG
jgi:hypothetical protein